MDSTSRGYDAKLSGLARMYFLLSQNRQDARFRERDKGNIVYIVDNDVLFRYLNPFGPASMRYMRIFEEIHSDDVRNLDDDVRDLLSATAYTTTEEIFEGVYADSLLLSPAYKNTLIQQVSQMARNDISDTLREFDPEKLATFMAQLRRSLSTQKRSRNEEKKLLELRRKAPQVALSVMFEEDQPLPKLAAIIDRLTTSNQEYLAEIDQRSSDFIKTLGSLETELFERRSYLVAKGFRTEDNLRDNVSDDALALAQCIHLNWIYRDKDTRFHFLSGDSGIHQVVDRHYNSRNRNPKWPSFNFVRRPLQLSHFMQGGGADDVYRNERFDEMLVSLGFFFDGYSTFGGQAENQIHNLMYHWIDERENQSVGTWEGLVSGQERYRTVALAQIEREINRARESALLIHSASVARKLGAVSGVAKKYIEDMDAVLNSKDVIEFLSESVTKYNDVIVKLWPYIAEEQLHSSEAMVNAIRTLVASIYEGDHSNSFQSRNRKRLPYFPLISSELAGALAKLSFESSEDYAQFLQRLAAVDIREVNQITIFVTGVLGDWSKAADLSTAAMKQFEEAPDVAVEFKYLRALSLRHIEGATKNQLDEAWVLINEVTNTEPSNPRYYIERAAQHMAWLYHNKFYDWSSTPPIPTAESARNTIDHAEKLAESFEFENSFLESRFLGQVHGNKIVYFIMTEILNLIDDPKMREIAFAKEYIRTASDELLAVVEGRGGVQNVSYYLEFLSRAGEIASKKLSGDIRGALGASSRLRDLVSREAQILEYDKSKMLAVLEWVEGSN